MSSRISSSSRNEYQMHKNHSTAALINNENKLPTLRIKKSVQYDLFSQATTVKTTERKEKLNHDLRSRLKVNWRKIYRSIIKIDLQKSGLISTAKFGQILHANGCFISREELLRLAVSFGNSNLHAEDIEDIQNDYNTKIDYEKLSKEMGLHHSYLDLIKSNQLDSASKSTLMIM